MTAPTPAFAPHQNPWVDRDSQTVALLDRPAPGEFSIVFLPDSQEYVQDYPEHFLAQTRWIVAQREHLNIQAVLHEGDVVNRNEPQQWANADLAIGVLDAAEIPYLIAIGNHDYDVKADAARRASAFNSVFPPERYTGHPWWRGGFFEPGHTENAFCRLTVYGVTYLLLSLEFGPRQEVTDWANALLARFSSDWAILLTHCYLYIDGTWVGNGDRHNPKAYALGPTAHDGEDLWAKLVSRHDNLHWVQSGHHVGAFAAYRQDQRPSRSVAHQVFANWQQAPNGGDGWLRIVTLGETRAQVQTYSPTLLRADTAPEHKFTAHL